MDERPRGGRSSIVMRASSDIQRWECPARRWRRRRRNVRVSRPFIARFMSVASMLDLTGRHEGMGVSIRASDDSRAAAIPRRSTGRASTPQDCAITRSNSSARRYVWASRARLVACSHGIPPPPPTRMSREYPGAVTALANPRGDADQPPAETLTEAARTVRLASPSLRSVVRFVLIVVACGIGLYLAWRVRDVIRLVAISVFFALTLMPIVDAACNRTRAPRALVILVLYVLLIAAIALVGYVVVPSLVKEVRQLSHNAPQYTSQLRHNSTFRHYDNRYHISTKLVRDARGLPHLLGHLAGPLKDVTVQAFSFIGQLITVLAIAFLLVLHGREYVNMGLSLTGARQQHYRQLIIDINKAVAGYMLGNVTISMLATVATWIILSLLGVPYALSLGLVVGFFDLIPLVGATLGAIVVSFATLTVSFPTATIVWIAFIIVWQRFEDYVVQPLVYGKALRVNPIVTIVSVLVGASLLGILGALLAIPTAAAIQIVLRDWWGHRKRDTTAAA
jgi:predicted PurR-regulated permease PerM